MKYRLTMVIETDFPLLETTDQTVQRIADVNTAILFGPDSSSQVHGLSLLPEDD